VSLHPVLLSLLLQYNTQPSDAVLCVLRTVVLSPFVNVIGWTVLLHRSSVQRQKQVYCHNSSPAATDEMIDVLCVHSFTLMHCCTVSDAVTALVTGQHDNVLVLAPYDPPVLPLSNHSNTPVLLRSALLDATVLDLTAACRNDWHTYISSALQARRSLQ